MVLIHWRKMAPKEGFIDDPLHTAMLCATNQMTKEDVENILFYAEDVRAHLSAMPELCTPEQFETIRRWVFEKMEILRDEANLGLEFTGLDPERDLRTERDRKVLQMMEHNPPKFFDRVA